MSASNRLSISGLSPTGASTVVTDSDIGHLVEIPGMPTVLFADLFATDQSPPELVGNVTPIDPGTFSVPRNGGHVLRLLEFLPDPPGHDVSSVQHATDTVDHVVVLDGEVVCIFDDGEVVLRPGDVLVQRGVQHAWSNRREHPCRVLAVIIDATPASTGRATSADSDPKILE